MNEIIDIQRTLDKVRNKGFFEDYEINFLTKKAEGYILWKNGSKEYFNENRQIFCVRISSVKGSHSLLFTKGAKRDFNRLLTIAIKHPYGRPNTLLFPMDKSVNKYIHYWNRLKDIYSDFRLLKSNTFENYRTKISIFVNKEYILNSNGGYGNNLSHSLRTEQLLVNRSNNCLFRSFYSSASTLNKNLYYNYLFRLFRNYSVRLSSGRFIQDFKVIFSPYATIQFIQFLFPFIQNKNDEKIGKLMEEFVIINNSRQLKYPMYLGCDSEAVNPRESLIIKRGRVVNRLKTYTQSILDSEDPLGTSIRSEKGFLPFPSPRNVVIKTYNTEDVYYFVQMKKTVLIHSLEDISFAKSNSSNLREEILLVGLGFLKDPKLNNSYKILKVKLRVPIDRIKKVMSSKKSCLIDTYYAPFLFF